MTEPNELRRLAGAATPGPWDVFHPERDCFDPATGHYTVPTGPHVVMKSGDAPWETAAIDGQNDEANAAYIAAMHPQTTLALLDRLARAEALVADARRFRWVASLDHGGTREIRLSGVKRNGDAWSHGISWNRTSDHADIRAAIDAEMKEQGND